MGLHPRLAVPSTAELTAACLFVGACQAAFLRLAWGRRPAPAPARLPSAAVFIPVKGASPELAENARAYLAQDYAAPVEFVFVTPDPSDPATPALEAAAGARPGTRVLSSRAVPERSSGMNTDLAWAVSEAKPAAEVLVFAVIDCAVRRDWLAKLVAPLATPGAGLAMSTALPVPRGPSPWGVLRMLWIAAALPLLETFRTVGGDALAMRRGDFERLDVLGLWRRAASTDLVLSAPLREAGLRPVFVPEAVGENRSPCPAGLFWGTFNKWMAITRSEEPWLWAWGTAFAAFKAFVLVHAAVVRPSLALLGTVLACDSLYLALAVLWARSFHPGAFEGFPGGAAGAAASALGGAAALPWVYLANAAASLRRRIRWSGRSYVLGGRLDVRAD